LPKNDGLTHQQRFWLYVNKASGVFAVVRGRRSQCWYWTGGVTARGYGGFWMNRMCSAHRVAYEFCVGPIPAGFDVDHLCVHRRCVRPSHLEAVTRLEHTHRGNALAAVNIRKTACPKGHPYDGVSPTGSRTCSICARDQRLARYAANPQHYRDKYKRWAEKKRGGPALPHSAERTHCPQGHPYDKANTVILYRRNRPRPTRGCRACRLASMRSHRERQRKEHQ
jgi:hypothetical protein